MYESVCVHNLTLAALLGTAFHGTAPTWSHSSSPQSPTPLYRAPESQSPNPLFSSPGWTEAEELPEATQQEEDKTEQLATPPTVHKVSTHQPI